MNAEICWEPCEEQFVSSVLSLLVHMLATLLSFY